MSAEYNILFLGETQSGKSTMIESLKKYADLDYIINWEKIGNKTLSCTRAVTSSSIETSLPLHFVTKTAKDGNVQVDYDDYLRMEDIEDYEDALNDSETYHLKREESMVTNTKFNLIDTPGLNDTSVFDEGNIAIVLKALQTIPTLHLFAITITDSPFTEGLKNSLRAYLELLPEFSGNTMFVHTRIDYARLHPEDTEFANALMEKKTILQGLLKCDSVPHLLIDNDIGTKKVVRDCITQNTLRTILDMAKLNQPIPIRTMQMNKTAKMQRVDELLRITFETTIEELTRALNFANKDMEQYIVDRIKRFRTDIAEKEEQLKRATEYLRLHDNDALDLVHEEIYQKDFSIMNIIEGSKSMFYPGRQRAAAPGFVHHIIDHIDIRTQNVKILQEVGGRGEKFWAVRFRRRKHQNGLFHVKIYITRRKRFCVEIERKISEMSQCRILLRDYEEDLIKFQEMDEQRILESLLEDLKTHRYLLDQVSSNKLDFKIFEMLVEAEVYVRDLVKSSLNVEKFYLDRRRELESEREYVLPLPANSSNIFNDASGDLEYEDKD